MKAFFRQAIYVKFIFATLIFSGCEIINPDEEIPAYLHISDFTFTTDSVKEGTASNKITDVWVSAGGSFLGAFEMPVTIPSLEKGNKKLLIRAGVKESGISANRVPYPFYQTYEIDLDLKEAKVDTLKPVFKYLPQTKFSFIENFENSSVSLMLSNSSTTNFRVTNTKDSAFEGNSALTAQVDPAHVLFQAETKETYNLPRGKPVWVELNYKSEVPVEIGVISLGPGGNAKLFSAGMNPSAEWNKIHINLTSTVSYEPTTQVFKIYLAAFNQNNGGKILIDNLKLLYLE